MVYVVVIQYQNGEPMLFEAYHDQAQAEGMAQAIRNDLQGLEGGFIEKVYVRGVEIHQ